MTTSWTREDEMSTQPWTDHPRTTTAGHRRILPRTLAAGVAVVALVLTASCSSGGDAASPSSAASTSAAAAELEAGAPGAGSGSGSSGVAGDVAIGPPPEADRPAAMVAAEPTSEPAPAPAATASGGLITAVATGTASGTPDIATVSLGVQTTAASAQAALDDNNQRATDLLAVLRDQGVAPADVQTSQVSVSPTYDQNGDAITGYQVTNMVTATVRPLSSTGALLDAVTRSAGDAVRVHGIGLSIDDDTQLRAQARADAVAQARTQAEQLAEAAGVTLGAVHAVTEGATGGSWPREVAMAASAEAAMPIVPGSAQVAVQVQVSFEIG
ncbi:SIMPL domain-containing protein [Nakamurella leprariae]|uniref:SIMPL domain-containing protein n=1 Tax=Nakamurella leprariae TaxID=2803911 RepID=A0A938YD65_9ACTN|nr:SIMPL domain-containing protein [Nakamurella leprariae]MBM9466019.1 SIMPL domain-containing protein [Nakamurella leprariae]